jgi:hypothetical protein
MLEELPSHGSSRTAYRLVKPCDRPCCIRLYPSTRLPRGLPKCSTSKMMPIRYRYESKLVLPPLDAAGRCEAT